MSDYKKVLENKLKEGNIKCPDCNCKNIGIDNWDMFKGERDWFYYCEECDVTFVIK